MLAVTNPMRTAVELWKLRRGAGAISGAGAVSTDAISGGRAKVSGTISSRCGLPQRWQKRASGGNSAPQVQNSGMIGKHKPPQSV
jgi:hypothetical protein